MKRWQRFLLFLTAVTGSTVVVGVVWFLWLLVTSPSEPDGFGQDHQEQWAVTSCWRAIRDGRIAGTEQCSDYAKAHLDFFTDELAADAATTTCNLSRSQLSYARNNSPEAKALISQLEQEVRSDCSHPGLSR